MRKKVTSLCFVVLIYLTGIGVDAQIFKLKSPSASMSNLYGKLRRGFDNLIHLPDRFIQTPSSRQNERSAAFTFYRPSSSSSLQTDKIYEFWPTDRQTPQSTNINNNYHKYEDSDAFYDLNSENGLVSSYSHQQPRYQSNWNYNREEVFAPSGTGGQTQAKSYHNNIQSKIRELDNSKDSSVLIPHSYGPHPSYFGSGALVHFPPVYSLGHLSHGHVPYGSKIATPAKPPSYGTVEHIPTTSYWAGDNGGHNPGPGSFNPPSKLPSDPIQSAPPSTTPSTTTTSTSHRPFYPQPPSNNRPQDPSSNHPALPQPQPEDIVQQNCSEATPLPFQPSIPTQITIGSEEPPPVNHSIIYMNNRNVDLDTSNPYDMAQEYHYNNNNPSGSSLPNSRGNPTGKANRIQLTSKVVRTPPYAAPVNPAEFNSAIIDREAMAKNNLNENPFESQLRTLGTVFNQLETFERDRPPPAPSSSFRQGQVEGPLLIILNNQFNLALPNSSEKAILDSYYNFGLPVQNIRFGDLNILREAWENYYDNPEQVDGNQLGRTVQEIENNILDTVTRNLQTTKLFGDDTFRTAKDILKSPLGFSQLYEPPPPSQTGLPQCPRGGAVAFGAPAPSSGGGGGPPFVSYSVPYSTGALRDCSAASKVVIGNMQNTRLERRPGRGK